MILPVLLSTGQHQAGIATFKVLKVLYEPLLALSNTRALLLGMPVPVSEAPRKRFFSLFFSSFLPLHFPHTAPCCLLSSVSLLVSIVLLSRATLQGRRCHL